MTKKHFLKRKITDELVDEVITYDRFKFILDNLNSSNYGHFVLVDRDVKEDFFSKLLSIFSSKPRLFKEAIYSKEKNFEEYNIYRPDSITFYDKYPTDSYTDTYCLVGIDNKIELRHCTKTSNQPEKEEIVKNKQAISNVRESFTVLLDKVKDYKKKSDFEFAEKMKLIQEKVNFDIPIKIFSELGYLSPDSISTKTIVDQIINAEFLYEEDLDKKGRKNLCEMFYIQMGLTDGSGKFLTDRCIYCDYEFIDSSDDYIYFMQKFGTITNNELKFTNISLRVDDAGFENIDFTVNEVNKSWRLEREGYILSEFFSYFATLTKEFNTTRKFTCYTIGQALVVDYASDEEQELFIKKTRIKRKWLE